MGQNQLILRKILVLILAVLLPIACLASPSDYGLPKRLARLTDLNKVTAKTLTPVQLTDIYVSWLAEEQAQPSKTQRGFGGEITSGYIQAQLILSLGSQGDPLAMTTLADNPRIKKNVRDALTIALGYMGDAGRIQAIITILADHPDPYLRQQAAQALGQIGAKEAIHPLEKSLQDPYATQASSCFRGEYTCYPVRESAEGSLRRLRDDKEQADAMKRRQAFTRELTKAQKTPATHRITPSPLVYREK